jgi:hypothetical protein
MIGLTFHLEIHPQEIPFHHQESLPASHYWRCYYWWKK